MFAFGFVANVDEPGGARQRVETLLESWPYTPPAIRAVECSRHAAAGILSWPVCSHDAQVAPISDPQRGLLIAGDVRLYERQELKRQLDMNGTDDPSDLVLAYRAYLRWGPELARHLNGDFALAVWDERERSLFLLRDHVGVRPLFYRVEDRQVLVATDVAQIVRAARGRLVVDPDRIAEHLLGSIRHAGRTYFRDIRSVPPGHGAWVHAGRVRLERHWLPPAPRPGVAYSDECAEMHSLFVRAVRSRLESERTIVAHSSGGFDSSTIVMVAENEYQRDGHRPPLVLASALTPGMPCDDSRYMRAVGRCVRFESFSWNALDGDEPKEIFGFSVGNPDPARGMGGGRAEDLRLARERRAGILLTGLFGDTVLFSFGFTRDLARNGRWLQLLRLAASTRRPRAVARMLLRSSLGLLRPRTALTLLERWNRRAPSAPPDWMGPRLRERYPQPFVELDVSGSSADSHLATETWARLTNPAVAVSLESTIGSGARAGLEVRIPFLDVPFLERILQVPWDHRAPRGDPRRLGRDALGHLLPPEFSARRDQGSWAPVHELQAKRMLPAVRRALENGDWLSEPFVDKRAAALRLQAAERGASSARLVVEFGIVEAWLRYVFREVGCGI